MTAFDTNKLCRYYNTPCKKHECASYVQLLGSNPQTGEPTATEWACLDYWHLLVTLEGNKETRQLAGSVDSMRNRVAEVRNQIAVATGHPVYEVQDMNGNGKRG